MGRDEEIKIIYEDEEILVLDKPAGVVVTREGVNTGITLEDWVKSRWNWAENLPRGGIVHRLDKGTSGVLVLAKGIESLTNLKKQFKDRLIKKKYIVMVGGNLPSDGEINMPIGRSKRAFGRWEVGVDGKVSVTKFKRIGRYLRGGKNFGLLEIDLMTGRTHQIRVHMNYLGWPVVGDLVYGGDGSVITRPFLHAWKLKFSHPGTGVEMEFESGLATDLVATLAKYEQI